jgi:hypothetical protein
MLTLTKIQLRKDFNLPDMIGHERFQSSWCEGKTVGFVRELHLNRLGWG